MSETNVIRRSNTSVQNEMSSYKTLFNKSNDIEQRKHHYELLVKNYYSLSTDFFEYGWGQSFHFANRFQNETLSESIQRHESYLALRAQIKSDDKVLDMGCGIGGPLRRIAHLTGAHITGVTISEYQIYRAKKIGVPINCQFIHGDFMKLPFADNTFDHIYTIEAVCHAPNKSKCFAEAMRVLKPGGTLIGYDWCLTDKYDSRNDEHVKIKHLIEEGDGLSDLQSTENFIFDLKSTGFIVDESRIILEGDISWYQPFKGGEFCFSSSNFRTTFLGRLITRNGIWLLEKLGIAAQGSFSTLEILEKAGQGVVQGGETGIFTPYFFFLARKSRD